MTLPAASISACETERTAEGNAGSGLQASAEANNDGDSDNARGRAGGRAATRATTKKHVILFLAANPSDTGRLALDREAHAIHIELRRSGYRDRFDFVTRWAA